MKQTYTEAPRELEIYDSCDVLVVGSGAAGHSAAIAERLTTGLLIGIEFDESIIASGLREELFRAGFLVSAIGRSVIRIAPPLIITKSQATSFVKALDSLLATRMGIKPNPIISAFKNIGRKENPAAKALSEAKPEEPKPTLPAPEEDELS